jgi:hypothetical protein
MFLRSSLSFPNQFCYYFSHGIRAYHMINVAHTTYPVTRTRKNASLHMRNGVEK